MHIFTQTHTHTHFSTHKHALIFTNFFSYSSSLGCKQFFSDTQTKAFALCLYHSRIHTHTFSLSLSHTHSSLSSQPLQGNFLSSEEKWVTSPLFQHKSLWNKTSRIQNMLKLQREKLNPCAFNNCFGFCFLSHFDALLVTGRSSLWRSHLTPNGSQFFTSLSRELNAASMSSHTSRPSPTARGDFPYY